MKVYGYSAGRDSKTPSAVSSTVRLAISTRSLKLMTSDAQDSSSSIGLPPSDMIPYSSEYTQPPSHVPSVSTVMQPPVTAHPLLKDMNLQPHLWSTPTVPNVDTNAEVSIRIPNTHKKLILTYFHRLASLSARQSHLSRNLQFAKYQRTPWSPLSKNTS